ncbi:MAG: tryptophan synthase subunit beta, partial [Planctomycetota bacterium]|nr:tryptophan synthase subunit beta [Planctomycetota bacterium]
MSDPISAVPNSLGRFGEFGGRYVPETLTRALDELAEEYARAKEDPAFQSQLTDLFNTFVGRPSPLYFAERLTEHCGGAEIWLKREDTNHTGAHKIN